MFNFFNPDHMILHEVSPELMVGNVTSPQGTSRNAKAKTLAVYANSLDRLFEMVSVACPEPRQGKESSDPGGPNDSFHALSSYEETMHIFRSEPQRLINFEVIDEVIRVPPESGNLIEHDLYGDYLDMDRYLTGEPEVFARNTYGNPTTGFISIYFNPSINGGTSQVVLNTMAGRVQRLVDWIEGQRMRTEIAVINSHSCLLAEVMVKHFEEPFNITSIAVAMHSEFFRRILFRLMEYSPTWQWGYGMPTTICSLPVEEVGMKILIDIPRSVDEVNTVMDALEADLKGKLEEGERQFTLKAERKGTSW